MMTHKEMKERIYRMFFRTAIYITSILLLPIFGLGVVLSHRHFAIDAAILLDITFAVIYVLIVIFTAASYVENRKEFINRIVDEEAKKL